MKNFKELEVGKSYRNKLGGVVKIILKEELSDIYPFKGDNYIWYSADGLYINNSEYDPDLIELIEEPEFEMVTSKGLEIEQIIPFHNYFIVKIKDCEVPSMYTNKGLPFYSSKGSLIPINPRKKELQAKEAELLKQLEEVRNELNTQH
jgi:hypothetical protein